MKPLKILICAGLALLMLQACAQKTPNMKTQTKAEQKILVAYFSATGTTRNAAQKLAEAMGADLHEIKPETPYSAADLDWHDQQSRSSVEMKDKTSRPAITDKLANMADYDVIFIGFPIWWYTAPTIINTFMECYDFQGKTLIPFATSGGSAIDKSHNDLKAAYPNANWQEGRLLNAADPSELEAWKEALGL